MKYKDFKVDDEVWCLVYGKGVVVEIIEKDPKRDYNYSIVVKFEKLKLILSYGIDGKYHRDVNRTLFVVKRSVNEKNIKELYFKLLGEVEEVEFKFNEVNCFVNFCIEENGNFTVKCYEDYYCRHFENKYISENDAVAIIRKMKEFIGNK